ncbi:hypothetical protein GCM10007242_44150 [Pigmentiphaga litoralis]|nr:hypothetical protein GCM10007242_44150 [Pigmentiphaga litoralis]
MSDDAVHWRGSEAVMAAVTPTITTTVVIIRVRRAATIAASWLSDNSEESVEDEFMNATREIGGASAPDRPGASQQKLPLLGDLSYALRMNPPTMASGCCTPDSSL